MDTYRYLLDLAIILISTKLLGLLTRRVQMPQVVGALLAGLILGPAGFGILSETSFIHEVAEIGVIVLMFTAGMETDIKELKASGKLPAEENFIKDEWTTDKIAIDMSGMMEGNIKYTEDYRNEILSGWLNVDTSSMPPIYTMSNQVYLIRLKDNTYAAIRFTNYTNARGIKGYIDFDFLYPLDFEENN